jgi:hypothetical protein
MDTMICSEEGTTVWQGPPSLSTGTSSADDGTGASGSHADGTSDRFKPSAEGIWN